MKIVVCIKQVPDIREAQGADGWPVPKPGAELTLNPFCEYAIETALRLKEAKNGEPTVVAVTVGGAQAKDALKKAVAMGCDEALLVQADEVATSGDSLTAAQVLAKAIPQLIPDYTVIFAGQYAIDGATGQTSPQLAELLQVPHLSYCKQATWEGDQAVTLHRETAQGTEVHQLTLPGVVAMMKCDYDPRIASIKGVMKANRTEIPAHSLQDLGLSAADLATPSRVVKSWRRPAKTGGTKVEAADPKQTVSDLLAHLQAQKVLA